MMAFRNNGHHLEAMRKINKVGQTKSITWEAGSEPAWDEVKERLQSLEFNS